MSKAITMQSPEFNRAMRERNKVASFPRTHAYYRQKYANCPPGNARPITEIIQTGAWKGRRCFIIGGGPSLVGFDFSLLKGEKVIAINRAYEHVPFADIMFSMDSRYYQWIQKGVLGQDALNKFRAFKGIRVWLNTFGFPYNGIYTVGCAGSEGLSETLEQGLMHGNNSGYAAVNLAYCLRANPIYLLGYDMGHNPPKGGGYGKTHFHSGYPSRQSEKVIKSFIHPFRKMALLLGEKKVRVINLNPDSALKYFEVKPWQEVLDGKT